MVLFYAVIGLAAVGTVLAFRRDWAQNLPIGLYLFLSMTFMASTEANFGTMIRHRDFITPFFLLYAAMALACFRGGGLMGKPAVKA